MQVRRLSTFEAFHRLVPSLVARLGQDRGLALRAMANPILAIEELGIQLAPEVAREVERRARFGKEDRERLAALEVRLFEAAGEQFDPESPAEVERVLFSRLQLQKPAGLTSLEPPRRPVLQGRRIMVERAAAGRTRGNRKGRPRLVTRVVRPASPPDPLLQLEGQHEIVDLLLRHRAITLRVPAFAPREAYEALKAKAPGVPVSRVVVHLPQHEEGGDA